MNLLLVLQDHRDRPFMLSKMILTLRHVTRLKEDCYQRDDPGDVGAVGSPGSSLYVQ